MGRLHNMQSKDALASAVTAHTPLYRGVQDTATSRDCTPTSPQRESAPCSLPQLLEGPWLCGCVQVTFLSLSTWRCPPPSPKRPASKHWFLPALSAADPTTDPRGGSVLAGALAEDTAWPQHSVPHTGRRSTGQCSQSTGHSGLSAGKEGVWGLSLPCTSHWLFHS